MGHRQASGPSRSVPGKPGGGRACPTAGASSCPWAGWVRVTTQLCKGRLAGPPTAGLPLHYQEKQQPQNKPSLLGAVEAGPAHLQSRCLPTQLQIPSPLPTCGLCPHRWSPRLKVTLKKDGGQLGVPRPCPAGPVEVLHSERDGQGAFDTAGSEGLVFHQLYSGPGWGWPRQLPPQGGRSWSQIHSDHSRPLGSPQARCAVTTRR